MSLNSRLIKFTSFTFTTYKLSISRLKSFWYYVLLFSISIRQRRKNLQDETYYWSWTKNWLWPIWRIKCIRV